MSILVIGVDPGLAHTGFVVCTFNPEEWAHRPKKEKHLALTPVQAGVIKTRPDKKRKSSKALDLSSRLKSLGQDFLAITASVRQPGDVVLLGYELFTPNVGQRGQFINLAALYTLAVCGMFAGIGIARGWPVVPIRPAESKGLLTGMKSSPKTQVYAVRAKELKAVAYAKWHRGLNEHVGDAMATAVATANHFADRLVFISNYKPT